MSYIRTLNTTYEQVELSQLKTHPSNPRRGDLDAIKQSISINGFYGSVVVNRRTSHILAGNHRYLAAKDLGYESVPVTWVDVGEREEKRILAADNRTSELGGYDDAILTDLLQELSDADMLEGSGYGTDELEEMIAGLSIEEDTPADAPPPPLAIADELRDKWQTERGQIWQVGEHRLMCGDCRNASELDALMGEDVINVAFTSPPYASQRKYDESSGFKAIHPDEYVAWFAAVQDGVKRHLAEDGSWFVNIKAHCEDGQRHLYVMDLVLAHVRKWDWRFIDDLVWSRSGLPGTWPNRFKNQHEPIFHFTKSKGIKFYPDSVSCPSDRAFLYQGSLKASNTDNPISFHGGDIKKISAMALPGNLLPTFRTEATPHQAAFPVSLPSFFIKAYSDKDDVIYDPFMGSGSTAAAAQNEGRRALGMEISPSYLAVQLERLSEMGLTPELVEEVS